jgi:hypothetical protein
LCWLGEFQVFQKPHLANKSDPFAKLWGSVNGANVRVDNKTVDDSELFWELEHEIGSDLDMQDAVAYMRMWNIMPKMLSEQAKDLDTIKDIVVEQGAVFARNLEEHLTLIQSYRKESHQRTEETLKLIKSVEKLVKELRRSLKKKKRKQPVKRKRKGLKRVFGLFRRPKK